MTQEVTVIGEVQSATSYLHEPGINRDEYVRMSGGVTQRADKKRIYVVRANGSVVVSSGSAWYGGNRNPQMQPGDTVVVPLDAERMRALPMWQSITTIIYNLAVAAAAVSAFRLIFGVPL